MVASGLILFYSGVYSHRKIVVYVFMNYIDW